MNNIDWDKLEGALIIMRQLTKDDLWEELCSFDTEVRIKGLCRLYCELIRIKAKTHNILLYLKGFNKAIELDDIWYLLETYQPLIVDERRSLNLNFKKPEIIIS